MTITHLYVITGASRGLGEALAEQLLSSAHQLICISRTRNDRLVQKAEAVGAPLVWIEQDLTQLSGEASADSILRQLTDMTALSSIPNLRLINNAGMLDPIGAAQTYHTDEISRHIAVNLTAPLVLTSAFLRLTGQLASDKRIMQISSGAGRKPYAGWSAYCATKAGLDHFSSCVKLEQDGMPHGARIASVAPGVIDTAMQASIRAAGEERFPSHARFVELHETGGLLTPTQAAGQLIGFLEDENFGHDVIADIRDWPKGK